MFDFFQSGSYDDDELEDGVGSFVEDDDVGPFDPDSDGEDFEDPLRMRGRESKEPEGHVEHDEYNMEESGEDFESYVTSLSVSDDNEKERSKHSGEEGRPAIDTSSLYDDNGLPVIYEDQDISPRRSNSALGRLLSYAREDLAATFVDPKTRADQKIGSHADADIVNISTVDEEPGVGLNESLDTTFESASGTVVTALDDSRVTSNDSLEEVNVDVEEGRPIILEGTPKAISSGKRKTKSKRAKEKKVHFRLCGHGIFWTALALCSAITGTVLSAMSLKSREFVTLAKPMTIAPIYNDVDRIGLLQMEVCLNEEETGETGCNYYDLSFHGIDDKKFQAARVMMSLSTFLGLVVTAFLATGLCWESINLRPISIGFMIAYFLCSFTMIFFDSDACSTYECHIGPGAAKCIGAAICWVTACVSVTRMDNFKSRAIRRRKFLAKLTRRREREMRRLRKQMSSKIIDDNIMDVDDDGFQLDIASFPASSDETATGTASDDTATATDDGTGKYAC